MPTIYLEKRLYDELIRQKKEPSSFVNETVRKALALPKEA
jgi:hypothetical protein